VAKLHLFASRRPGEPVTRGIVNGDAFLVTRLSLVERLADRDDQANWRDFFETYWKLLYGVARKAGLNDAEAQDVVQETVITVCKNIGKFDRSAGSFKNWLLQATRWRIADQFRKREPAPPPRAEDDTRRTATVDRVEDPCNIEDVWEAEWKQHLLATALERVKRKVEARHYQIFDCYVVKDWPAQKVAKELRVNIAQVYLARHRVGSLVRKEITALENAD